LIAAGWQGQDCKLTLHHDTGFTLISTKQRDSTEKPTVLWSYPYDKLRMSADDGQRLLWLDFGEDGEQVGLYF